jgi:hypothetical protein
VAIPRTPVIQHQNTAPGPPIAIAVEMPMILPVPIVAARAVARAASPAPGNGSFFGMLSFPGFFSTTVHAAAGTRFFSGSCLPGAKKAETDPQRDLSLDKARTDRKVNMGSHQKDEHGESPQKFL